MPVATDLGNPIRVRIPQGSRPKFDALKSIDAAKRVDPLSTPEFLQVVIERGIVAMIDDLPAAQAAKVRNAK